MTGQFVISKAGHDKDTIYVVVAEEKDFVYLSDGRLKPPERPKKKNKRHVQPMNRAVEGALLEKLTAGGTVEPERIRYAIKTMSKAEEGYV